MPGAGGHRGPRKGNDQLGGGGVAAGPPQRAVSAASVGWGADRRVDHDAARGEDQGVVAGAQGSVFAGRLGAFEWDASRVRRRVLEASLIYSSRWIRTGKEEERIASSKARPLSNLDGIRCSEKCL